MRIEDVAAEFEPAGVYLGTATYGLPPRAATAAVLDHERQRAEGRMDPLDVDAAIARSRAGFARLVGVDPSSVAVASQVSQLVGLVASALPDGASVLVADGDFTSVLFPFAAQGPRLVLRSVPLEALPDQVERRTDVVAVSLVQSANGRLVDRDALVEACAAAGARLVIDATQAVGWLPVLAGKFDLLVCGGYKWLLGPRGTCFLAGRDDALAELCPQAAGWFAGDDPWTSIYGLPLRLAEDAQRFDVSPAWGCWVGQAPALELLEAVGIEQVQTHDVALANRFRSGLGLAPGDSAIVSSEVPAGTEERLAAAGVVTSVRAGRLRCSFHLYNTDADVDAALAAIGPGLGSP
ncbi:aminotransferase class V-fold PLP-dependent enzyme [soil metagenome]